MSKKFQWWQNADTQRHRFDNLCRFIQKRGRIPQMVEGEIEEYQTYCRIFRALKNQTISGEVPEDILTEARKRGFDRKPPVMIGYTPRYRQ